MIQEYLNHIQGLRRRENYAESHVGNMDQTMVRFDMSGNSTNEIRGEKTIRIAKSSGAKRGFTVALAATGDGRKLPAFIVFKEPSGKIPHRVHEALVIPRNVRVTATKNGWMTRQEVVSWVTRCWGLLPDEKKLLILDKARIHETAEVRTSLQQKQTNLVHIPGGCTAICQPADVSWNRPFKSRLRKEYRAWRGLKKKTPKGNIAQPSRQDVINWISKAWADLDEEMVKRSFKVCGITSALDGSEDDMFHEKLADAMAAARVQDECREDAAYCILDSDDDDDQENDFEGFSDVDLSSSESE